MLYKKIQNQNHDAFDSLNHTIYCTLTKQLYYVTYNIFYIELTTQINRISTTLTNNIK